MHTVLLPKNKEIPKTTVAYRDKSKEYFVHYSEIRPLTMQVAAVSLQMVFTCAVSPTAECTELRKLRKASPK